MRNSQRNKFSFSPHNFLVNLQKKDMEARYSGNRDAPSKRFNDMMKQKLRLNGKLTERHKRLIKR